MSSISVTTGRRFPMVSTLAPLRQGEPHRIKAVAAVAVTLLVASTLVLTGAREAAADPPLPTVGLDLDATPFIGEQVTMELTFANPAPADTGYGPFTDLFLATNGADGTTDGGPATASPSYRRRTWGHRCRPRSPFSPATAATHIP
ncbi:MAG: hypothetical protein M5U19_14620 [Microthrixaceae bacterium]|nr:hypothetical protein [Microthrixaceae bacterium]